MQIIGRKRILMAEDNPHDVELTLRVLRTNSIEVDVDVVEDGEEALDYLYRRNGFKNRSEIDPAIILLDMKMPKLGGAEILQQIKSDERFKCLPAIMLTSSGEIQDIRTCYRLGANGYVIKPVDAKEFVQAIKDLMAFWLSLNQPPPR